MYLFGKLTIQPQVKYVLGYKSVTIDIPCLKQKHEVTILLHYLFYNYQSLNNFKYCNFLRINLN